MSIEYNPDDFENNNPFSEPVVQPSNRSFDEPPSLATSSVITEQQDELPDSSTQGSQEDEEGTEPREGGSSDQSGHNESNEQLSEEMLRKLIPERFTDKYELHIRLVGIEKNKLGNPILKMDAQVKGLPKFRQTKYKDIRRTFNEVVKFNKYLVISNLEVFVPVIPNATTSYPTGGEDETKQLMMVWQEWLNRITSNPILIRDEEFVYFIENDFGYAVINSNRKQSVASGLMRKTLKQFAVPYDQYEDLASFRPMIKDAYLVCQKLHRLLDKNSRIEKQSSIHTYDLANKLNVLAQFEVIHPGMKNMWEKLGKITQIQSDLTLIESISSMGTLGDGLSSFIDDFYQIKEALTNRHLIMRELLQAEAQTTAKHLQASKVKNKSSLDPIKVDEALRSLEYATKVQESLNLQVKRISGEMQFERKEVIEYTEMKFQKLIKSYILHKVDHHRKILKHLENIRLDIRIVDEKGGLSRLNRDNLANLKHNLIQSQSAKGDSWSSRTFRSLEKEEEEKENRGDLFGNSESGDNINNNGMNGGGDGSNSSDAVDPKNAASLLGVAIF
ncbi:VPS17 [[Candida] subhashii]|uniref:Vacuolar protein sorting-associated protein 17 n=1 Tax=[Candida] subhashii TaxID=561895 RepID=A0A8J5UL01_9ASCO|nr:VPS17 [[Candida] subhashii]KAG7662402.1 VPS17 [[Candida] subhashii]